MFISALSVVATDTKKVSINGEIEYIHTMEYHAAIFIHSFNKYSAYCICQRIVPSVLQILTYLTVIKKNDQLSVVRSKTF